MLGLMTTAAAQAMKGLVAAVRPGLKDLRYRKRGNTFNRITQPDGLIHVINFQMGAFHPPGTAEIPGLRPNLYGRFTINLGIWLPALTEPGSPAPAQRGTRFINDYDCHLRARIGELLPEPRDTWWPLTTPADQLTASVSSAITEHALPWLARFCTWDDTLRQLEAAPPDPNWFMSPPRLTAMRMRLARSEHAAAEQDFAEHVEAYVTNPRNPGHLDVLAEIATQHSFKIDVTTAAAGALNRNAERLPGHETHCTPVPSFLDPLRDRPWRRCPSLYSPGLRVDPARAIGAARGQPGDVGAVHQGCPSQAARLACDVKEATLTDSTAVVTVTLAGAAASLASESVSLTYSAARWGFVPNELTYYRHGSVKADIAAAKAAGYCASR
jgi:hypothetical protein